VLDYNLVAVKQTDAGDVVWRSSADAPVAATGDAAAGLLELRFDAADAEDLITFSEQPGADGARRGPGIHPGGHRRFGFGGPRPGGRGGPPRGTGETGDRAARGHPPPGPGRPGVAPAPRPPPAPRLGALRP